MLRNIISCVYIVATIIITTYAEQDACENCIGIRNCTIFMDFVKSQSKPLPHSIVKFLKERQCGFENGFPKVCCGEIPKELKKSNNVKRKITKNNLSAIHEDNFKPKVKTTKRPIKSKKIPDDMVYDFPHYFLADIMGTFNLLRRKRDSDNVDNGLEVEIR